MKKSLLLLALNICFFSSTVFAAPAIRIMVVDSYHPEYLWSQHINEGFCDALLAHGYLDNKEQVATYNSNNLVETPKVVVKKLWMDTKRKKEKDEIAQIMVRFSKIIREFKPDLIFLGDDNAANYIGNQFLDTQIPIVFWGVNHTPVKYGIVDNAERPGHNVTGVYQTTYYAESLDFLKKIVPTIKNFAILSDDTTTGRVHTKAINHLHRTGRIPLKLVETVSTNDYELWKKKALELQDKVDAFFIAQYSGLKDKNNKPVPDLETANWYLNNIKIPETAGFRHRVVHGMLCAADDSGYSQGYEAVVIANDILANGADPATYPPRTPKRGPLMVNKQRAKMLGITLTQEMGIEEYIEKAAAIENGSTQAKKKILVVSSYHREYTWTQETNKGMCDAMLKHGYLDNKKQVAWFTENDHVESSQVVMKKLWMDSKRRSSSSQKTKQAAKFYNIIKDFQPDIVLLGDDNAANYIGNHFLDSDLPMVFWGLNRTPVKYGLLETQKRPGHNVTGVYQTGYYLDSLNLLKKLAPTVKTFAVLSDRSPSGRPHYKALERLSLKGELPLKLVETVTTEDYDTFKKEALRLQKEVDAFYISSYIVLKYKNGDPVPDDVVAAWYVANIKIPEVAGFRHQLLQGMLCGAIDSGYNQAYQAMEMAHRILDHGASPATYPARSPGRGPLMVNSFRAKMLGISLNKKMGIEEYLN